MRQDLWWVAPVLTAAALLVFIAYSTWAAFQNANYYAGPSLGRDYLSPFYSPCIADNCAFKFGPILGPWYEISPAIFILVFPLGFRLTCYYYRRSYYRSFWWAPPACAVADARPRYTGESRFPLIFQNVHRYFFYFGVIFAVILTFDAVEGFRLRGGVGMGLGSLMLLVNAVLIWLYTLSCHSCRHLCGGMLDEFSKHPIRHRLWKLVTPLNKRHMLYAWLSLFWVAWTDLYIRLVASGTIHDPRFF
ncbi:MAG: hypothetical protein ACRDYD_09240 [Acidimicrobiales bacterium]